MAKTKTRAGLAQWLGVALIVLLLDQLSKLAIVETFAYGSSRAVTGFLNLVLVYNPGAAFSMLAQAGGWQRWLFMGIGVAAAALMIRLLQRHPGKTLFCTAIALVLGGAIGNVIDRIVWGHVIDFIDVYLGDWHWPAFNLADSAITVGAVLLLVDELRRVQRN